MTQYNFDQIIDRQASESIKWHSYDEDVLPMWVADMDFISPEPVIKALCQRVEHGVFGYPSSIAGRSNQRHDLRQVIAERIARLYNWQIEPTDVVLLPGVVTGFNLACHALATPEQAVLIQTPVYPPILHAAQETGILHQEMELTREQDGSYTVDWDQFEASFTAQSSMFLLCNPHNPVGKVFTRDELFRSAEICLRHGVTICSDEIHCDLVYSGHRHTPIAALDAEIANHTITLMAPSKTYNLAGLECSFAVIPNRELRKRYLNAQKGLVPWVKLMGTLAAQIAYEQGDEWLNQLIPYLEDNRDALCSFVETNLPGVHTGCPQGTYLAWLDCRSANLPENPYQFFLERGRVAFNDGDTFGKGGQGFVRLNFGCPRPVLMEGLARMKKALETC